MSRSGSKYSVRVKGVYVYMYVYIYIMLKGGETLKPKPYTLNLKPEVFITRTPRSPSPPVEPMAPS